METENLSIYHLWNSHRPQIPLPMGTRFKIIHSGSHVLAMTLAANTLPIRRRYHFNLKGFSLWVLTTSERRCALLRTERAPPPIGSLWNLSSSQTLPHLAAIRLGIWLLWQSWSSSKELVEKYLWTLNSFAKPAPAYRSARTPVVVQAPFQNNQPWACLLELIPTSAKAHLSGKASNGNVKLPFMDNWPQALGEILQVLITLTVQNVCLIFGGRASWAPVTCKWLLMHFLRQKKLESPCH